LIFLKAFEGLIPLIVDSFFLDMGEDTFLALLTKAASGYGIEHGVHLNPLFSKLHPISY
jgi:hypothetical protein